jgi:predicted component of type VI protein secretion system
MIIRLTHIPTPPTSILNAVRCERGFEGKQKHRRTVSSQVPGSLELRTRRKGKYLIGRAAHCDLIVDHESVSRAHVILVVDGDFVYAHDVGAGGTAINNFVFSGPQLPACNPERAALRDGDILQVGAVTFRVTLAPSPFRNFLASLKQQLGWL